MIPMAPGKYAVVLCDVGGFATLVVIGGLALAFVAAIVFDLIHGHADDDAPDDGNGDNDDTPDKLDAFGRHGNIR